MITSLIHSAKLNGHDLYIYLKDMLHRLPTQLASEVGKLLKGADGDAIHAVLCGAGHNLRLILAHLRVLLLAVLAMTVIGSQRAGSPAPGRRFAV